jgi:hypothetical protein
MPYDGGASHYEHMQEAQCAEAGFLRLFEQEIKLNMKGAKINKINFKIFSLLKREVKVPIFL